MSSRYARPGRIGEALAAEAHPPEAAGRVAGNQGVVGHVTGHDRSRADGGEAAHVRARDDDGARADRANPFAARSG